MSSFVVLGKLVTLAGPGPRVGPQMRELGVIEKGAMLVREGRICWVGAEDDSVWPRAEQGVDVIDARSKLVTPGLVDAHAHPVFGGNRAGEYAMRSEGKTYEEIAAAGGGILSTVAATRSATEQSLVAVGKRHALWMLSNGTTTLEAKSGYGLSVEDELKILRAIRQLDEETPLEWVPTFLGAHAFPEEYAGDREGYIGLIREVMLPTIAAGRLAEYADAFFESSYFDREACLSILGRAKELGLKIRLHADQLTKGGGAQLAAELGAKTADHLEQTDEVGIRALAAAGVQPVLLPGSVYALGRTKYPAARAMIDAGLAVVLATDFNPGSSPVASLPFVMSLACTHMKMVPEETITAATINAAHSLDRGDRIGSLEVGKRADFVIWDCGDPREIAYWVGAPLVERVYVAGQPIFSR